MSLDNQKLLVVKRKTEKNIGHTSKKPTNVADNVMFNNTDSKLATKSFTGSKRIYHHDESAEPINVEPVKTKEQIEHEEKIKQINSLNRPPSRDGFTDMNYAFFDEEKVQSEENIEKNENQDEDSDQASKKKNKKHKKKKDSEKDDESDDDDEDDDDDDSEEESEDDSDDSDHTRRQKKKKKSKKNKSESDDESDDDRQSRKKRNKKKTHKRSEEDDSDYDDRKRSKKKGKKKSKSKKKYVEDEDDEKKITIIKKKVPRIKETNYRPQLTVWNEYDDDIAPDSMNGQNPIETISKSLSRYRFKI